MGKWDPDVKETIDCSGGCENGTQFVFVMNTGSKIPIVLSDVELYKSITFSGNFLGGLANCKGVILIDQVEATKDTKITYSFEIAGIVGSMVSLLKRKEIVEGTEYGLKNIIQLSEQRSS